ncbi:SRPBCC domain-containing protein [bacterium]|nr:SRPBCC domain-containing protein [bacterium]MBU1071613.1 SRPBCC domain-containing protein [bacterium]MBU1674470.1 SRPBCC domain-containing protein [bacterium]
MSRLALVVPCLCLAISAGAAESPAGAFSFRVEVAVPGQPGAVYDATFGDVTGWWDHSMSGDPLRMYIEPKPGGAFMEIFDESGDGVRHAVVTYAKRGEMLRFEGPLGLAGNSLHMVTTWTFADAEEGHTLVAVEVHAAGEVDARWPAVIERTWVHFLVDRLKPYLEGGGAAQD